MDEERRRADDAKWDRVFTKLDKLNDTQIEQGKDITHMHNTLFKNNGEMCIVTKLDNLNKAVSELTTQRFAMVTTAQAIWTIIFGFLSIAGTVSAIILTVKQIRG